MSSPHSEKPAGKPKDESPAGNAPVPSLFSPKVCFSPKGKDDRGTSKVAPKANVAKPPTSPKFETTAERRAKEFFAARKASLSTKREERRSKLDSEFENIDKGLRELSEFLLHRAHRVFSDDMNPQEFAKCSMETARGMFDNEEFQTRHSLSLPFGIRYLITAFEQCNIALFDHPDSATQVLAMGGKWNSLQHDS